MMFAAELPVFSTFIFAETETVTVLFAKSESPIVAIAQELVTFEPSIMIVSAFCESDSLGVSFSPD